MKKLGIVGGTGWISTVEYYASICRMSEEVHGSESGPAAMPEIVIESLDLRRAFSYIGTEGDEGSWQRFDAYHHDALVRLRACSADVAILASNTPHHRFTEITRGLDIPVLNIFDETAKTCADAGFRRVLVLGTDLTMRTPVLRRALGARGVEARYPVDAVRQGIVELIATLQRTTGGDAERRIAAAVASSMDDADDGSFCVALACTELPLAFPQHTDTAVFKEGGITFINTLAVHAQAAFNALLA